MTDKKARTSPNPDKITSYQKILFIVFSEALFKGEFSRITAFNRTIMDISSDSLEVGKSEKIVRRKIPKAAPLIWLPLLLERFSTNGIVGMNELTKQSLNFDDG